MIQVLPAGKRAPRPWKNGGGVTFDIVRFPEGASLDDFLWRIAIAEVAGDGPFSRFPGIDRSTAILAGEGFRLAFGEGRVEALRLDAPALAYPGDIAADCTLLAGPVRDLNVMTRRGIWRHRLTRVHGEGDIHGEAVLVCPRGKAAIAIDGARLRLGEGDAVRFAEARFETDAPLWLAELHPA